MNVSLQDAYDVACREIGEAKVREHFLTQEVARLNAELENAQRMYEDLQSARAPE